MVFFQLQTGAQPVFVNQHVAGPGNMSEEDNFLQLRRDREARSAPEPLGADRASGAAAGFDPAAGLDQTKGVSFSSRRHTQSVNVHDKGSPRDRELPGMPAFLQDCASTWSCLAAG